MPNRRLSWKTAHRKNRPSSFTTTNTTTVEHQQVYSLVQSLNPYKPRNGANLRGSTGAHNGHNGGGLSGSQRSTGLNGGGSQRLRHSVNNSHLTNSIQDGSYERNTERRRRRSAQSLDAKSGVGKGEEDMKLDDKSDDESDDDLDNILMGIEQGKDDDINSVTGNSDTGDDEEQDGDVNSIEKCSDEEYQEDDMIEVQEVALIVPPHVENDYNLQNDLQLDCDGSYRSKDSSRSNGCEGQRRIIQTVDFGNSTKSDNASQKESQTDKSDANSHESGLRRSHGSRGSSSRSRGNNRSNRSEKQRMIIQPVDFDSSTAISDVSQKESQIGSTANDNSENAAKLSHESEARHLSATNKNKLDESNNETATIKSQISGLDESYRISVKTPEVNTATSRCDVNNITLDRSTRSIVDEIIQGDLLLEDDVVNIDNGNASDKVSTSAGGRVQECESFNYMPKQCDNANVTSCASITKQSASLHESNAHLPKLDPIESIPQIIQPASNNTTNINPTNIFGHHHNQDDTISTVTDQTDTPYIFTYKRAGDDDTVSQITSSLAPSLGSLRNIQAGPHLNIGGLGGVGVGINRGKSYKKRGAVPPGTFGRDRSNRHHSNNHVKNNTSINTAKSTSSVISTSSSKKSTRSNNSNESPYREDSSNLDEIAFAINNGPTLAGMQRQRSTRSVEYDLHTIDSEKSGVSRRRSCYDPSTTSLGGGSGCVEGQSKCIMSKASSSSRSGNLMRGLKLLARKAEWFFLPNSGKVTQRKKFDRSDSLEDLLMEEGAKTLPYRRASVEAKEEDIDYFSRAMSTSSYGTQGGRSRPSLRNTRQKTTVQILRLCVAVVFGLGMYFQFFTGDTNDNGERGVKKKLRNIGRRKERREYGPMNDPIQSENDPNELQRDRYSDPDLIVNERKQEGFGEGPRIPPALDNVANVDAGPFQRGIDVPFYWHVPRSGGGTISDALGSCLNLALASDAGSSPEFARDETLRVVHSSRQLSFVNIDTYTPQGIQRAKHLNLVTSGLADVVMSPLLYDTATLFTPTRKGRMFTMLRHPIERAVSLFYFIQDTQWKRPETRNDKLADMAIESFYELGLAENNWMTRFLTNQLTKSELTDTDLDLAKQVLKQKFLIGLIDKKAQSFDRFQKYFGWIPSDDDCIRKKVEWSWPMKHHHASVEEGSEAWNLISKGCQSFQAETET